MKKVKVLLKSRSTLIALKSLLELARRQPGQGECPIKSVGVFRTFFRPRIEPIVVSSDNKPIPNVSYDVSAVPPELWGTIATFASRQSLARLSAASHEFYYKLSPLLYGNIVEPPLTAAQSSALIETLCKARTPSGRPHLAEQVQQLKLMPTGTGHTPEAIKAQNKTASDVLRNMYRLIPGAESRSGSVLRVLHWNLAAGALISGRSITSTKF
jgi:hypothetical protein